jgi:hypothetical protein
MKAKIDAFHQSLEPCEELVGEREVKKATHDNVQSIKKALYVFPRPISKTYVMQKVFIDPIVVDFVLKSINSQIQN